MLSNASTVTDMGNRQPAHLRRWKNKSTTSAMAPPPVTPLKDRTNTTKTSSTPGSEKLFDTTFLPEMHSTPPMPTFQKPVTRTPPSTDKDATSPSGRLDYLEPKTYTPPRQRSDTLPTSAPATFPLEPFRSAPVRLIPAPGPALRDDCPTPPLPSNWRQEHDRAICVLDVRGYTPGQMVPKMRRAFPTLRGVLTPPMLDRRLRQLDQIVEVDYWKVGLDSLGQEKALGVGSGFGNGHVRGGSSIAMTSTVAGRSSSGTPRSVDGAAGGSGGLRVREPTLKVRDHVCPTGASQGKV